VTSSDLNLDVTQAERIGFDEAILCAGKSAEQLERILDEAARTSISLLLTRLDPAMHVTIPEGLPPRIDYDPVARAPGVVEH
jgi:NCAIR mutase (PurE)-related protein